MVDTTELDYIRTFLNAVTTSVVFQHVKEVANLGSRSGLIHTPEIIGTDLLNIDKMYKIQLHDTSEANLCTVLNDIIIGVKKIHQGTAIGGGYTKPASLVNFQAIRGSNQARYYDGNSEASQDILLIARWVIS